MFKTLKEIPIKKQFQIKKIIKKADRLGLDDIDASPSTIATCSAIENLLRCKNPLKYNENVTTIHCKFDYYKAFYQFDKTGTILFDETELHCTSYNSEDGYEDQYLFYKISNELQKNRIVFLFIDILNYITYPWDDGTNAYLNHSVCGIFHPNKQNKYDFLYFNSHGKNILEYTHYEYMLSQRRTKQIPTPLPMEYYFNQKLIESFNQYTNTYDMNVYVHYQPSSKFNYQNFNLQSGDNYGICFVFPYILWYSIIYNYSKSEIFDIKITKDSFTFIEQLKIPGVRFLLSHHSLFRYMEKVLIHYDKEFKHLILKNWHKKESKTTKLLDSFIEKKGTAFVKNIIYYIVSFIGQKKIKDKIREK